MMVRRKVRLSWKDMRANFRDVADEHGRVSSAVSDARDQSASQKSTLPESNRSCVALLYAELNIDLIIVSTEIADFVLWKNVRAVFRRFDIDLTAVRFYLVFSRLFEYLASDRN